MVDKFFLYVKIAHDIGSSQLLLFFELRTLFISTYPDDNPLSNLGAGRGHFGARLERFYWGIP